MQPNVEIVADHNNRTGESPVWDAARGLLWWVDNVTGELFEFDPARGTSMCAGCDSTIGAVAINADGRLVVAGTKGILLRDAAGAMTPIVAEHDGVPLAFNDITVSSAGEVYGGTFYWGADGMERHGKLYRIRRDGAVDVLDDGIALSNGLGFSPDNRTLYFTDTMERRIYAYEVDVATGGLHNRRVLVDVPSDDGLPDGLAVDADGHVWSAMWYGGVVIRYDPTGCEERRIRVPALQTSSVAFGGAELTDLYITTAGEYWPSELQPAGFDAGKPMGGPLYRARLELCGRLPNMARLKVAGS